MKIKTYTITVEVGNGYIKSVKDDMPKEIELGILKDLIKDFSLEEIWKAIKD